MDSSTGHFDGIKGIHFTVVMSQKGSRRDANRVKQEMEAFIEYFDAPESEIRLAQAYSLVLRAAPSRIEPKESHETEPR